MTQTRQTIDRTETVTLPNVLAKAGITQTEWDACVYDFIVPFGTENKRLPRMSDLKQTGGTGSRS